LIDRLVDIDPAKNRLARQIKFIECSDSETHLRTLSGGLRRFPVI